MIHLFNLLAVNWNGNTTTQSCCSFESLSALFHPRLFGTFTLEPQKKDKKNKWSNFSFSWWSFSNSARNQQFCPKQSTVSAVRRTVSFSFFCRFVTSAPEWSISFQRVLGLCLKKRKQQLLLSQDFLTRSPWRKKKTPFLKCKFLLQRKLLQMNTKQQFLLTYPLSFSFSSHRKKKMSLFFWKGVKKKK